MKNTLELWLQAKEDLETNPSEGQVEKSVLFPLLDLLGYKRIESKVPVVTYAGQAKIFNRADS